MSLADDGKAETRRWLWLWLWRREEKKEKVCVSRGESKEERENLNSPLGELWWSEGKLRKKKRKRKRTKKKKRKSFDKDKICHVSLHDCPNSNWKSRNYKMALKIFSKLLKIII